MVIFLYCIMCTIFGTTFLFIKWGLDIGWSPFLFSSLRFIIAGSIVVLLVTVFKKENTFRISLHSRIAYLSFFMTTLPFAALYCAEQHISSGEAAILVATSPFFILLINYFSKAEKFSIIKMFGSLISLIGIILIVFNDINISTNLNSFLAKCFLILGEVAFAYGSVESKEILNKVGNPFSFNGYQMLYGGLLLFLMGLLFKEEFSIPSAGIGWGILIYFILFASILSYGIFYWLINKTNVFFSSTWTYVSPVIALFLGAIVFKEDIGLLGIIGSFLILTGVILSNLKLFKKSRLPISNSA